MASGTRRPTRSPSLPVLPGPLLDASAWSRQCLYRFRATRLGRRVARRRLGALAAAAAVTLFVSHRTGAAQQAVDRWGPTAPVLVAAAPLAAGTALGPGSVRTEQWPSRLVPAAALTSVDGRRTARTVAAGVPLTDADLAGTGRSAVAARLPDGSVGVTLPRGTAPAPVRTGDRVDVLGAAAEGRSLTAERVAVRATVVAVDRTTVTVAVRRTEAGDVAAAAAAGTALLVLVP